MNVRNSNSVHYALFSVSTGRTFLAHKHSFCWQIPSPVNAVVEFLCTEEWLVCDECTM